MLNCGTLTNEALKFGWYKPAVFLWQNELSFFYIYIFVFLEKNDVLLGHRRTIQGVVKTYMA